MFTSHNPEETIAFGESWGRELHAGSLIGITGELGAGKTQLVKGLARGLNIEARIHSPTFNLVNLYETDQGRLPLAHLDLYRLETHREIIAAGLEEYLLQPLGVTVVEWIERWPTFFACLKTGLTTGQVSHIRIDVISETERRLQYERSGP
jgi:tRNA threonylcarbamoyladenosine biosynthesis protein TsaE